MALPAHGYDAAMGNRPRRRTLHAAVALAIALDRAEHVEEPVKLLGWL